MDQVCLVAYSDEFQLRARALDYIATVQQVARQLNVVLTDFCYHTEENLEDDAEAYALDAAGLSRLEEAVKHEPVSDLELWSDFGDLQDKGGSDLDSEFVDAEHIYGSKYIYLQFPVDHFEVLDFSHQFAFMRNYLSLVAELGHLEYALVTIMPYDSLPALYFRSWPLEGYTAESVAKLARWRGQIAQRKTRLAGLFWGNVLSAAHLSRLARQADFMARLESLIGTERIATITGADLFFMLPSPNITGDPIAASVEALLREHDLLA